MRAGVPAVAAVAFLCWWVWPGAAIAPPSDEVVEAAPQQPGTTFRDETEIERQVVGGRDDYEPAAIEEEPEDADLTHAFQFELTVSLKGPFGLPVDGASVFLAPELAGFCMWPEQTRSGGRVHVAWRGRKRAMSVQVAVMVWGVLQPIRVVTVDADVPAAIAFAIRGREQQLSDLARLAEKDPGQDAKDANIVSRARSRPRKRQRMDALDILCGRTMVMFKPYGCVECHEPGRVSAYQAIARSSKMQPGLHPDAHFEDLRMRGLGGDELRERKKKLAAQLRERELELLHESRSFRAQLKGVVQGANGKPAVGVPVAWVGETGSVKKATTTDSFGHYRLAPLPGGNLQMIVGGGALGIAESLVRVSPVDTTHWNTTLSFKQAVMGRVLDEKGEPLARWPVEIVRDAAGWAALAVTNRDGEFAAYGVPGAAQCLAWPRGANHSFPVLYGDEALVDASVLTMKLDSQRPTRGRLRVSAVLPVGFDEAKVDARVVQVDTGRVAQMTATGFGTEFVAEPLAPGAYRVQLGAAGLGWSERVIVVDGRGLWNLGVVHLGAPGRVRLRALPEAPDVLAGDHAFYRRTEATDVLVEYTVKDGALELGPGLHVFVWRSASGLRAREVTVVSGAEVELPIWPE